MEYGWAINLGGGMSSAASANEGDGWCLYADVQMSITNLVDKFPFNETIKTFNRLSRLSRKRDSDSDDEKNEPIDPREVEHVMIIDLNARRGMGHAFEKRDNKYKKAKIYIVDIHEKIDEDETGRSQIDVMKELDDDDEGTITDEIYLSKLDESLDEAFKNFKPNIVYYLAGSDILTEFEGMSSDGMARRDRAVFEKCFDRGIPIVMMLSSVGSAKSVSRSLKGLLRYIKDVTDERLGNVLNFEKIDTPIPPATPMDKNRKVFDFEVPDNDENEDEDSTEEESEEEESEEEEDV